ncbi:MAG: ACT domain-containing protein [Candidatus Micrarchaeia archaeon]
MALFPALADGEYYVSSIPEHQLMGIARHLSCVLGVFREEEGISVIFSKEILPHVQQLTEKKIQGPFALITFRAQTSLNDDGITAVFSAALARAKIPANVFAGYHHDHVLVPYEKREAALSALKKL